MARGRQGDTFTFDLEPDEEPPAAADALSVRRRRLPRAPGWRAVTGVAAALVLAVGAAGPAWQPDVVRDALLATAPGGVLDLGHAPRQVWRVEVPHPDPVAVMRGLLVLEEDPSSVVDPDGSLTLHGIDPATGRVRWTTVLPETRECGGATTPPDGGDQSVGTAGELVCLGGPQLQHVVVVGPGGAITADRAMTPADGGLSLPLAGGRVLRAVHVGRIAPAPTLTPTAGAAGEQWTLDAPFATAAVRVWVEDAATGAVRVSAQGPGVVFAAGATVTAGDPCVSFMNGTAVLEPDGAWGAGVHGDRAEVETCGMGAAVDLTRPAVTFSPADPTTLASATRLDAVQLLGGGYAVEAGSGSGATPDVHAWQVFTDGGDARGFVPGQPQTAWASDGTVAPIVVAGDTTLAAYAAGTLAERWSTATATGTEQLLAAADGVLLVARTVDVTALDTRTGKTRWTVPLYSHESREPPVAPLGFAGVYTDGGRVVVVENAGGLGAAEHTRWIAIDVASGRTVWRATLTGPAPRAVAGHLVRFDDGAVVGLG